MIKGIAKVKYHYAKYLRTETVNGRSIRLYDTPIELEHNVKRASGNSDYSMYGNRIQDMFKAVISNTKDNRELFTRFSLAYLDGVTPSGELNNGDQANFFVADVAVYNLSMHVYFERLPSKK